MELDQLKRNRLVRLVILCHNEQLINRNELARLLELFHDLRLAPAELSAAIQPILRPEILTELNDRLLRHNDEICTLNAELYDVNSARAAVMEGTTLRETPITDESDFFAEDAPEIMSSDLQVSFWPRLVLPLCILGGLVLVVFMVSAIQTVAKEYWNEGRSPGSNVTTEQSSLQDSDSTQSLADQAEDALTPPVGIASVSAKVDFGDAIANLAASGEWDKALQLLNAPSDEQRDASSGLWEAGVLIGADTVNSADQALHFLLSPEVLDIDNTMWQDVYAAALMRASDSARKLAYEALKNSSARAFTKRNVRRLLDWAAARNGDTDLEELRKRSADFQATSVDHLFLAVADLASGKGSQTAYHAGKARRRFDVEMRTDEQEPEWLYQLCRARIQRALSRLEDTVKVAQ